MQSNTRRNSNGGSSPVKEMKTGSNLPSLVFPNEMADNPDIIFAVGDIHGCDAALKSMLHFLLPLKQRCVFLGDYIDRGPSSIRVIEQLVSAKISRPDWVFLLGNHELMLRDNLRLKIPTIGENTGYEQYMAIGGIPAAHQAFFEGLLPYFESDQFLFVHGGVGSNPHLPIDQYATEELVWTEDVHPDWNGKTIVRGHRVVELPEQLTGSINLDTGCYKRRWLSAGILCDRTGQLLVAYQTSFDGDSSRTVRFD